MRQSSAGGGAMREAARLIERGIAPETVDAMALALRNLVSVDDLESRFSAYLRMHVQLPVSWNDQRAADEVAVAIERRRRAAGHQ